MPDNLSAASVGDLNHHMPAAGIQEIPDQHVIAEVIVGMYLRLIGASNQQIWLRLCLHKTAHGILPVLAVPLGKSDVLCQFHSAPFAVQNPGKFFRQATILIDAFLHPDAHLISRRLPLLRVQMVQTGIQMHFQKISGSGRRIMNHGIIGVSALLRKKAAHFPVFPFQTQRPFQHSGGFPVMGRMIDSVIQSFRTAQAVKPYIFFRHLCDSLLQRRICLRELCCCKLPGVAPGPVRRLGAPGFKIVGQFHEIAQEKFLKFQISHIDDPHLAHAVIPGLRHLLPGAGQRR